MKKWLVVIMLIIGALAGGVLYLSKTHKQVPVISAGIDLLTDKTLIEKATEQWKTARGANFKYVPLLGDRKPALNYRDSPSGSTE